jgi:hypothetical protein
MATKKSGEKKLTPRQHAFVKNLARGASQKDAFIAAGYKAKHPDQGAHQALKQIQGKVPQIMDQMGLTDHFLIEKYLVPLLEAEETKFFKEGSKRINVAALGIRHNALDTAFKLRGSYAPRDPAEAAQFGVKVIILDMPRPPKFVQNAVIDVSGNGYKPSAGANGKPPTDNNGRD